MWCQNKSLFQQLEETSTQHSTCQRTALYLSVMYKLEPPQHFLFEGNVSHTWKLLLKQFRFYLTATEKDKIYDKIKTSMLLTSIGQTGREIYDTFTFD